MRKLCCCVVLLTGVCAAQSGEPIAPLLPAGTILHTIGIHDNTSANRLNPDPNQWVGFGDRTVDEMGHAWVNITYMSDEDYQTEVAKKKAASQE